MKYNGVQCPVCSEIFDEKSDVVVCPECGTPHHRSCFERNGGCINTHRHSEGYVWENPLKKDEEEKDNGAPQDNGTPFVPPGFQEGFPKNGVMGSQSVDKFGNRVLEYRAIRGNEKIGEFTVDEYAQVIDKNTAKFIPKFMMFDKLKRSVSWNWAAFLLGPFYLAYRKMYKLAFLFLALTMLLPLVFFKENSEYYRKTYEIYTKTLSHEAYETKEDMDAAAEELRSQLPPQPFSLTAASYVQFAVEIICGIYANCFYKKHCEKVLKKAQTFDEKKRLKLLKRRGGRSFLGVVGLLFVSYLLILGVGIITSLAGNDLASFLKKFVK